MSTSTRSTLLLFGREKQLPTFDCSASAAVTAHAHRTPRQPLDRARVPSHRGTPSCWLMLPLSRRRDRSSHSRSTRSPRMFITKSTPRFLRVHGRRARGKFEDVVKRRPALERALGYRVPRREGRRMLPGEQQYAYDLAHGASMFRHRKGKPRLRYSFARDESYYGASHPPPPRSR